MTGRSSADLDARLQFPEDVVDLVLESSGQHLIGFIQNKDLDITGVYPEAGREGGKNWHFTTDLQH